MKQSMLILLTGLAVMVLVLAIQRKKLTLERENQCNMQQSLVC